jgi:hypothetical protein
MSARYWAVGKEIKDVWVGERMMREQEEGEGEGRVDKTEIREVVKRHDQNTPLFQRTKRDQPDLLNLLRSR